MSIRSLAADPEKRRRLARTVLAWIGLAAFLSLVGGVSTYSYFSGQLPRLRTISDYRPPLPTVLLDREGREAARFFTENRTLISVDQVPRRVIDAVLAIEDSKYYEHKGIDYFGILRAAIKNALAGRVVQGGSTITQQVAKSLLLTNERTYSRKIKEAILARRMDRSFSKDQILEIYLNQSYFGNGLYGIEGAALGYFSKHVWELGLPEVALLAGLPKAPSSYDPVRHPERAVARREAVLQRMFEERMISAEEKAAASAAALGLTLPPRPADQPAAYFSEEVRRYLYERYGEEALYRGGMRVFSTLDIRHQALAQEALRAGLRDLDKRQGYRGPLELVPTAAFPQYSAVLRSENGLAPVGTSPGTTEGPPPWEAGRILRALVVRAEASGAELDLGGVRGFLPVEEMSWARTPDPTVDGTDLTVRQASAVLRPGALVLARYLGRGDPARGALFALEQEPVVEGALVSLEAATGRVTAMVGGYDFARSEFNRATQARRQPGSAFKPIIYSAAMDNGFTPSSVLIDSPIIYDDPSDELKWKPENFEERFYGPTTLRTALTRSRNVITIKLVQRLGLPTVVRYARLFGLDREMPQDLSVSLGSMGVTPLEMTSAFTVFVDGGQKAAPWSILRIEDRDGAVLEQGAPQLSRVLSEDTAFIMQNLLRGVVQSGTGWRAKALNQPSGGKTGTTNDTVDAWFIGFTPEMVTGVWVGFDGKVSLGVNETGSRAALPIWLQFMTGALEGTPVLPFPPPPAGVEMVKVEPESGLLAGPSVDKFLYEAFKVGTAPTEYARAERHGPDFDGGSSPAGLLPQGGVPGILPRDF